MVVVVMIVHHAEMMTVVVHEVAEIQAVTRVVVVVKPEKVKTRVQIKFCWNLREISGDWLCSSCQNKNFAWRNECNRCKEPKADDGGSGGSRGPPQRGGFQSRDRPSGGSGGGGFGRGGSRGGGGFSDRFSGGNRQRPYWID